MLTGHQPADALMRALRREHVSYELFPHRHTETALAEAVRRVHAGMRVIDPALATETLTAGNSPLTPRERDVLFAARAGTTAGSIAAALHLSEGTVRNHLSAAIGKTGATTRAEAVRIAEDNGWL